MLTEADIQGLQPRARPFKITDSDGLYLFIPQTGRRCWRLDYRVQGKRGTISLGTHPEVSLGKAREWQQHAKVLLKEGASAASLKDKVQKLRAAMRSESFSSVAEEWIAKKETEGRSPITIKQLKWQIEFLNPLLGSMPIAEITPLQLLAALKTVEARGRYSTANRVRMTCGSIFRFAIATGRAERNFSYDLRDALVCPKVRHHPAILDLRGVGQLLRDIDGYGGQASTLFALKLSPHLFVRPSELRLARWTEFDFIRAVWVIPATRTRMRRAHMVPLSRQVRAMLDQLRRIHGSSMFLFPAIGLGERPLCTNSVNEALRRLGYGKDEMSAHGFRAIAATLLNESGKWHPDAIDRQLAHVETNDVRRAYVRGEHWGERVRMMQWWSDYLDQLRAIRPHQPLPANFGREW